MITEHPIKTQFRVLFALIMREMTTRYGRNIGGYVWSVLDPAGTVAMLSLVFSVIARHPALGQSFAVFFATGYVAFHFYRDISSATSIAVASNKALLRFPRVTMLDAIIARFILHLITATFVGVIIIGGAVLVFKEPVRLDFRAIFLSVMLASSLGLAVGLLNCSLFMYSPTWKSTFGIINRPLFLISGIFYLYEDMPRAVQAFLWWNPLIHITGLMRTGFYVNYQGAFASPLYVLYFTLVVTFFGILFMRFLRAEMFES